MSRVLAVVLLPVLAGCAGPPTVCPAVGYGVTLTVRLAEDWPSGVGREVTVDCPEDESCGQILALPIEVLPQPEMSLVPTSPPFPAAPSPSSLRPEPATALVADGSAEFSLTVVVEELVVTVREAGADVVSVPIEPDWVRVGGSEECGGPMDAEVVVPAP